MVELNMEHVLILIIAVFLLYHLMNRCSCNNGFSVGGPKHDRRCPPDSYINTDWPDEFPNGFCECIDYNKYMNTNSVCVPIPLEGEYSIYNDPPCAPGFEFAGQGSCVKHQKVNPDHHVRRMDL